MTSEDSTAGGQQADQSDEELFAEQHDGDAGAVESVEADGDTEAAAAEVVAAAEAVAEEAGIDAEPEDPAAELRSALRRAPGEWYVVHSYAGYENKVKTNLETRIQTLDMEEYIFQVEVPTEQVTEIKNGQRK
ncbi:MAG TPA: transcription termination/antitermination NusG family protein, partial [Pseudonocardiaceae bacterium]